MQRRTAPAQVLAVLMLCSAAAAQAQTTTRVTVATGGGQANGDSSAIDMSTDGRFVLLASSASNLVPGDTNAVQDVFVHDRQTAETTRVSVGTGGLQSNGSSNPASISADGRFVVFTSLATNLVPSDTNGVLDVFVHDRQTSSTTRVNVATGGTQAAGGLSFAGKDAISADGRFVVFHSGATNLVASDTNGANDIFVHDRQTVTTTLVSRATSGAVGNGSSSGPSISQDGRFVAFTSSATDLVVTDTNGFQDIFVRDLQTSTTALESVGAGGVQANHDCDMATISSDGRHVAFRSRASNLVVGDTNAVFDIFVRDRQVGLTVRASVGASGAQANGVSEFPVISANGRFIVFESAATNLVTGDSNAARDAFMHDLQTVITTRVSVGTGAVQGNGASSLPNVNSDGSVVCFSSLATNLVAGDTNGAFDGFVSLLTLPSTDDDSDGLPNTWETQFGLNPTSSSGADGASGDPDADGQTNAQELAAGTHPRGTFVRYLAEGATGTFFDSRIALVNPGSGAAKVLLRFLKSDGTKVNEFRDLAGLRRATIDVETLAGLSASEFSTVIESDATVVVDRTMTWDDGKYGSHAETAITAPATQWYLAEGSTAVGFSLFYLLQNPSLTQTAQVRVTYLLPAGAPLVKTYTVAPSTRFNIWVNEESFGAQGKALASTDVSAVIDVTSGPPIIVERAQYLSGGGQTFRAGHESAGVTAPALSWFLAEGATGPYFDEFVLIANPNATTAQVQATYLLPNGTTLGKTYAVSGNSRFNIWLDEESFGAQGKALADTAVSVTLTSTNGVPIVVERSMWWPGTFATWSEAHNAAGATSTGMRWALAEGEVGGPADTDTFILLANTASSAASVRVTLLFEDGTSAQKTYAVNPNSRFNVWVRAEFAQAAGRRFGALVESLGTSPAPIVVERAMYSNAGGVTWAAGTNALATKLQ